MLIISFFSRFSDESKANDSQQSEKGSKNGENANMEVESSEKDENVVSDADKMKENDEFKDAKETANDDKRMY